MLKEAEYGLLSSLINVGEFAHTLPIKLDENDFFDSGAKIVFRVVWSLFNAGQEKVNKYTIKSTARDMGLTEFEVLTDNGKLVDDICMIHPSKEDGLLFLKQVKKESIRVQASAELQDLRNYVNSSDDSLTNILANMEERLLRITSSADHTESKIINLADDIEEFVEKMGENPGSYGLDIGFKEWQDRVGGVAPGKVHMFIANFKTGKSTIGQRTALLLGKHIPVLIVDTEMTKQEQQERLFCQLIKMPYEIFKRQPWKVTGTEAHNKWYHVIQQGVKEFKKLKISYLEANNRSVPEMIPSMRRWALQNKVMVDSKNPQGLVIYDYVKLVATDELIRAKLQEWQKLGLDISTLKAFANKYRVPVITFGQTNREDDNTAKCLGASKRIGDNVDSLTLFKEKTPEILMQDPQGTHLFRIFAVRSGPGLMYGEHISVAFDKSIGHMQEVGLFTPSNAPPVQKHNKIKPKAPTTVTYDDLLDSQLDADDDE